MRFDLKPSHGVTARRVCSFLACVLLAGCTSHDVVSEPDASNGSGHLLIIGGGLEDDNAPVYERFAQLARRAKEPRIVIVTTASGDEPDAATGKRESFAVWCPDVPVDVIGRETPAGEAVLLIDRASALFFTGGDQKRITQKYLSGSASEGEWQAMKRLLARDGVIAGTSAGAAMMGEVMFYSGRSGPALGVTKPDERAVSFDPDNPPSDDEAVVVGPRIGPGMRLLPWAMTDSHFFERDRVGRLVAALEASKVRLGVGVGEDACVEVDLRSGELIGTSTAASLLVDVGSLQRDGNSRRGVRANVIDRGEVVALRALATSSARPVVQRPTVPALHLEVAEPGQSRQLASWRLFSRACQHGSGVVTLNLDGWSVNAWHGGADWSVFDVVVE